MLRQSWIIALVLAIPGCEADGGSSGPCVANGRTYQVGDVFPSGDGCNSCSCTQSGIACTERACLDAGVDANPLACVAVGGCPEGPACNGLCCGTGEKCVNGTCTCGAGPACSAGNSCEAAGPIGTNACGSVCCGASGPCPQ